MVATYIPSNKYQVLELQTEAELSTYMTSVTHLKHKHYSQFIVRLYLICAIQLEVNEKLLKFTSSFKY